MKSIEHQYGYGPFWTTTWMGPPFGPTFAPFDTTQAGMAALVAATRQAGTWNCPTEVNERSLIPFIKMLHDSGAGLLLGTDKNNRATDPDDGLVLTRHLVSFVHHIGLTPYQALVTGTRNVAAYFGTLDETGTVSVGKRADLVMLDGNPLRDVAYTADPAGVMVGGRWLPRAELDRRLAAAELDGVFAKRKAALVKFKVDLLTPP
jgi:imidazolonepropionase-like amidohydrolase